MQANDRGPNAMTDVVSHPTGEAARDAIWEHARAIDTCMLVTRNSETLRARPMTAILRTAQNEVWFFADANDHKDDELARDPHACLTFADPRDHCYVSMSGHIDLVRDRKTIEDLWNDGAARYFPTGPSDPRILLLRFEPELGEFWDAPSGTIAAVFHFLRSAVTGETRPPGTSGRVQLS